MEKPRASKTSTRLQIDRAKSAMQTIYVLPACDVSQYPPCPAVHTGRPCSRTSSVRLLLNRLTTSISSPRPSTQGQRGAEILRDHSSSLSQHDHKSGLDNDITSIRFLEDYNKRIEKLRKIEYPKLKGTPTPTRIADRMTNGGLDQIYLDNAGTQLPPKSIIDAFASDLTSHIYGNPHTNSLPARNSSQRVNIVRRRALEFFHASPDEYELIFTANASAAIKLVGEILRDYSEGSSVQRGSETALKLWYGYHKDAHNSLIGVRELTDDNSRCFRNDDDVEQWIEHIHHDGHHGHSDHELVRLFAFPGQSNMTGRRLPLRWLKMIQAKHIENTFTLLDAAALATTRQLEIDDWQPDFTAVSFYKIFGFPDLGALIIRKSLASLLEKKRFFGGGTVDGVLLIEKARKIRREPIHQQLEEGTLPFHSIIALDHALTEHTRLFQSMDRVSAHVSNITAYCAQRLMELKHQATRQPLCEIYTDRSTFGDPVTHGGTIAFNLYRADGSKIAYSHIETTADEAGIFLRSGAMCNPGGMATHLGWSDAQLEAGFDAGMRCSKPIDILHTRWTGVVRASFGANSIKADADVLIKFLRDTYLAGTS